MWVACSHILLPINYFFLNTLFRPDDCNWESYSGISVCFVLRHKLWNIACCEETPSLFWRSQKDSGRAVLRNNSTYNMPSILNNKCCPGLYRMMEMLCKCFGKKCGFPTCCKGLVFLVSALHTEVTVCSTVCYWSKRVVMCITIVTFPSVKHYCILQYYVLLFQSGKWILLEEEY